LLVPIAALPYNPAMISGYLPYLIDLILLVGFWGGIGAIDGWMQAIRTAAVEPNRSTLMGFLSGCAKGIGVLVVLILIVPLLLDWVQTRR
jgi:hypothetical protein